MRWHARSRDWLVGLLVLEDTMVIVIVEIKCGVKVLKSWYGRVSVDSSECSNGECSKWRILSVLSSVWSLFE